MHFGDAEFLRSIRSYLFITILALLCRFEQPFKLFHVVLYQSTRPLLFLRSKPDVCVIVSSDLTLAGAPLCRCQPAGALLQEAV